MQREVTFIDFDNYCSCKVNGEQLKPKQSEAAKMPYTNQEYLPSYEELTVPELEVTSAVFRTAAHHLGKYCDNVCKVRTYYALT